MTFVNFPRAADPKQIVSGEWVRQAVSDDPQISSTVVKLVVVDGNFETASAVAPEGSAFTMIDGVLVGVDRPLDGGQDVAIEDILEVDETRTPTPDRPWQRYVWRNIGSFLDAHFPGSHGQLARFGAISRPYMAAIMLGRDPSTYWSTATYRPWICRPEDLTEDGRKLYDILSRVYGGSAVVQIQTWTVTP